MDKLGICIPEKASQVWAGEVVEISLCVFPADELSDLLRSACLPFHISPHPLAKSRLLIRACDQDTPFPQLTDANIPAIIRASSNAW